MIRDHEWQMAGDTASKMTPSQPVQPHEWAGHVTMQMSWFVLKLVKDSHESKSYSWSNTTASYGASCRRQWCMATVWSGIYTYWKASGRPNLADAGQARNAIDVQNHGKP